MKKLLSITLTTLLVLFASQAFGQTSADVEVSADVLGALTLTPTNVVFGEIQVDQESTIAANENDSNNNSNVGASFQVGALQIEADETDVMVKINQMAVLNTDQGSEEIQFTPSIYNDNSNLNLEAVDDEAQVTVTNGNITLDIGGSLPAISSPGTYSTEFGEDLIIEVQYL